MWRLLLIVKKKKKMGCLSHFLCKPSLCSPPPPHCRLLARHLKELTPPVSSCWRGFLASSPSGCQHWAVATGATPRICRFALAIVFVGRTADDEIGPLFRFVFPVFCMCWNVCWWWWWVGLEERKGKNGDGGASARKQKKCLVELLLGVWFFYNVGEKKKFAPPPHCQQFSSDSILPPRTSSWTSWFIDALGCFSCLFVVFFFLFFLPQFSKGSDVSGLAPTLSINRFKSNKRGIFSRTCVHSPCLTVEQQGFFFRHGLVICFAFLFLSFFFGLFFSFYTSGVYESFIGHRPLLLLLIFELTTSTLHLFPLLSEPAPCPAPRLLLPDCSSSVDMCYIQTASTIFTMLLNQSQGPLSKLLAFVCGIIKNAPQLGVWLFSPR